MSAVKYWAGALFGDTLMFGSFAVWQLHGSEGAGNVFAFMAWFVALLSLLIGMTLNKTHFTMQRPPGFVPYNFVTELIVVACLAWAGMFWCAAFYAIGGISREAARVREPSEAKP